MTRRSLPLTFPSYSQSSRIAPPKLRFTKLNHPIQAATERPHFPMNDTTFPAPIQLASNTEPSPDRPSQSSFTSSLAGQYHALASNHPHAFYRLCLAVLCERWAAFMLISTAALMLCERFGLPRADALRLLGIASAANYVGSLPGGYLLDRTTDPRRGLGVSSLILLLGYTMLSLPYRPAMYVAFALLFIGHSLYRPSTQRILAALYATGDARIEGAQVLIHITANIGAAGGSLLAGILTQRAGWSVTYASAALMMSVTCALLWLPQTARAVAEMSSLSGPQQTQTESTPSMPQQTRTIAGLALAMFLFTLSTAQAEGALLLWSKDRIDRIVLGFEVPIAWFLAFPAILVLLLAPIQLALLPRLKRSIGTSQLVALGLIAAALCFAVLIPTTLWTHRVGMAWLAASLSFFVLAELLIAPLGLALLLRSTPPRFIGVVTGLWYGSGALGYFIGGEIGTLWSRLPTQRVLLLLTVLPTVGAVILATLTRQPNESPTEQ